MAVFVGCGYYLVLSLVTIYETWLVTSYYGRKKKNAENYANLTIRLLSLIPEIATGIVRAFAFMDPGGQWIRAKTWWIEDERSG